MQEVTGDCAWICPNDRHLALKAKLRSGWSVRTNQISRKDVPTLSNEELIKIRTVIHKASTLENMEQERIGSLVHRLDIMRQNSKGNGKTACILCAESFGKFIGNPPILCNDCKRNVCGKCCVDYNTGIRPTNGEKRSQKLATQWLCKLCSENRELWKRSGAWFFRMLPAYKLPSPGHERNNLRVGRRPAALEVLKKPHHTSSSSELEESSDDDGITLGKPSKQNIRFGSSDNTGHTSQTSGGLQSMSTISPAVSRQKSGRKTFRNKQRTPRVMVTSVDSRMAEHAIDDSKLMTDMSTLHGSNGSLHSERVADSVTGDKERGSLEFSVLYDSLKCALHVNIAKAENLISMDANGLSDPYVKLHLLPGITRATKLRTKTKGKTLNPVFNETLTYWGILEQELVARQLLLTVLDEDRFGQDFLGEVIFPLKGIIANEQKHYTLPLNQAYALREGEKQAIDPGRVYLGLHFHSHEHYLSVKIHRCTSLHSRKTDHDINAFAKATFTSDDHRSISQRTEVQRKCQNPVFDREMKFRVSPDNGQAELARGTLLVTVMHKDAIGQEVIGSLQFSINSTGDQLKHWFNCLKHADKQFDQWHILSHETSPEIKTQS